MPSYITGLLHLSLTFFFQIRNLVSQQDSQANIQIARLALKKKIAALTTVFLWICLEGLEQVPDVSHHFLGRFFCKTLQYYHFLTTILLEYQLVRR
jgi:hypothetical protein